MFFTLSFCQIVKVPSIFLYLETQNRHFLKQTQILQSLIHTRLTLTIFLFSLRPTLAGLKPYYVINEFNQFHYPSDRKLFWAPFPWAPRVNFHRRRLPARLVCEKIQSGCWKCFYLCSVPKRREKTEQLLNNKLGWSFGIIKLSMGI